MRKLYLIMAALLLILAVSVVPESVPAADYASFESFYKEGLSLKSWIIGGVLAVVGVAAVFFTAGAAAPFTAAIGSAIGGMMGLSGAAATSAGLALLGGGSLAAGGFGMLGGTVLLTAIFEGSVLGGTQIAQSMLNKKNYTELCEQVKNYPNFPPIQNGSGPKVIGVVKDELQEKYDMKLLPSSPQNISAVEDAIWELKKWSPPKEKFYSIHHDATVRREKLRVYSLRAILEFMRNDNDAAYEYADLAWKEKRNEDGSTSVPNFIRAVAGVFTGNLEIKTSMEIFQTVVLEESSTPILPLLYSIYISRVGAMNKVDSLFLKEVGDSSLRIDKKEIRDVVSAQIMTAILAKLWENQETINFYLQNADQLNPGKSAGAAKNLVAEYDDVLKYAKRYIKTLDRETDNGRDFYLKSDDALRKYANSLEDLKEAAAALEKAASEENSESQAKPAANDTDESQTADNLEQTSGKTETEDPDRTE